MITHRLIDLNWMDHIVMMDQGRVIAQGSHAELMENTPRYAELHIVEDVFVALDDWTPVWTSSDGWSLAHALDGTDDAPLQPFRRAPR